MGPILRVSVGAAFGLGSLFGAAHLLSFGWERYWRTRPSFVRGLQLPPSFVRAVWRRERSRWSLLREPLSDSWSFSFWVLREPYDGYGCFWPQDALSLGYGRKPLQSLAQPSDQNFQSLWQPRFAHGLEAWSLDLGFLPYPTDFSRILLFGGTDTQSLYFDYRNDPQNPCIIGWDGIYWRRVAPSFDALFSLLRPWDRRQDPLPQWRSQAVNAQAAAATVALLETAQYGLWDTEVLLHIVYSTDDQPTVVLLPAQEARPGEGQVSPNWLLLVTFPPGSVIDAAHPHEAGASVRTSGDVRKVAPGSSKAILGRAVSAVIEHGIKRHGGFHTPILFRAREIQTKRWAYCIDRSLVERIIGGTSHYFLSDDLSRIDFLGGK